MVRKSNKVDISEIFRGLQAQMEAKLTFNRSVVNHPTSKGTASELEWIDMLSTYLPRRYCAECAFVVDAKGSISEQIDIVIFDRQYTPFILRQNGVNYIPAESVYAVIEVKQVLNKTNIEYAQKKAASVRKLERTSVDIPHAGGIYPAKKPARILAGIVTVDGGLSAKSITLLANTDDDKILNFGCSLAGKTYFNLPKLSPWAQNVTPYDVVCRNDENSLVNFFMNLVSELQKVGTVPAIDIDAYLK